MKHAFITLLNMSISGGFLILIVLLFRVVFKKVPRSVVLILWAVVALRLLIPFSFGSRFSILPGGSILPENVGDGERYQVSTGYSSIDRLLVSDQGGVEPDVRDSEPGQTVNPVQPGGSYSEDPIPGQETFVPGSVPADEPYEPGTGAEPVPVINPAIDPDSGVTEEDPLNVLPEVQPGTEPEPAKEPLFGATKTDRVYRILFIVWLAGVAGMTVYLLISCLVLFRKTRASKKIGDRVYAADHVSTAFLFGIFRPRIYLPSGISEDEAHFVILHEEAHLRRGDHLKKLLGFIVLILHWFNPLVWIAYFCFSKDLEFSCDERVVRDCSEEDRVRYSETMLALASNEKLAFAHPVAFGEGNLKSRVKRVLRYRKPAASLTIIAVVLAMILSACLFTHRTEGPAERSDPTASEESGTETEPETETGTETETEPETEEPALTPAEIEKRKEVIESMDFSKPGDAFTEEEKAWIREYMTLVLTRADVSENGRIADAVKARWKTVTKLPHEQNDAKYFFEDIRLCYDDGETAAVEYELSYESPTGAFSRNSNLLLLKRIDGQWTTAGHAVEIMPNYGPEVMEIGTAVREAAKKQHGALTESEIEAGKKAAIDFIMNVLYGAETPGLSESEKEEIRPYLHAEYIPEIYDRVLETNPEFTLNGYLLIRPLPYFYVTIYADTENLPENVRNAISYCMPEYEGRYERAFFIYCDTEFHAMSTASFVNKPIVLKGEEEAFLKVRDAIANAGDGELKYKLVKNAEKETEWKPLDFSVDRSASDGYTPIKEILSGMNFDVSYYAYLGNDTLWIADQNETWILKLRDFSATLETDGHTYYYLVVASQAEEPFLLDIISRWEAEME